MIFLQQGRAGLAGAKGDRGDPGPQVSVNYEYRVHTGHQKGIKCFLGSCDNTARRHGECTIIHNHGKERNTLIFI